jgi:hypothetical protein
LSTFRWIQGLIVDAEACGMRWFDIGSRKTPGRNVDSKKYK